MKPILNLKSYTLTRVTSPDPVLGRKVAGVETTLLIRANLQPAGGAIKTLPEARRTEDIVRFFTSTAIYLTGQVDTNGVRYDADRITVKGLQYEVFKCDEWASDHFECFATKIEAP